MKFQSSEVNAGAIFIEKQFNASIEKVWKAWTEPALISKWFGSDPNGQVLRSEMNIQPGGNFEITFRDSDSAEHTCYGIYAEVQPFNKLSFTWSWKSEPGVESFVTVLLSPKNNDTLMQFEHADVGSESAHNYEQGWKSTFLKLERMLGDM